jgi:hypothetical protein
MNAAPPTWALSHARHLDSIRWLLESLVEEEAGRPLTALSKVLNVLPDDQRQLCLADLRMADYGGGDADQRLQDAIERTVKVYDEAMAAAYAPPLTDDEVHDCHTAVTPAMLARAELHELPHRCDPDAEHTALVDALFTPAHKELFAAAANYATAAALRAGLPQRVPGAALADNPPPEELPVYTGTPAEVAAQIRAQAS